MTDLVDLVRRLVATGDVLVSAHGYRELADDGLDVDEVVEGLETAVVIELYPAHRHGPCFLALQASRAGCPVHVVWGVPMGRDRPAVVVTAYRPDPGRWSDDFRSRRR